MKGYDIKPANWLTFNLRELWHFRELFFFLAWRDIKVKYKQTVLGLIWSIIQPIIMMLILSIIWIRVINVNSGDIPYPLFAYTGLIFWGFFSSAVSASAESMLTNSNMIKKVYFPRVIIPASSIIVAAFDYFITLLILIIMFLSFNIHPAAGRFIIYLVSAIMITLIASAGIGLIISSLTAKYRDFRYVTPFFLQAFFFLSPVIYPVSLFDSEKLRFFLSVNPLAGAITLARSALSGSDVDPQIILISSITTLIIFLVGITFFRRLEAQYPDII